MVTATWKNIPESVQLSGKKGHQGTLYYIHLLLTQNVLASVVIIRNHYNLSWPLHLKISNVNME